LPASAEADRWSAAALARLIARRELSAADALEWALERIERLELEPGLKAFLTIAEEGARAAAIAADRAVAAGEPLGPLHGVPVGVKDLEWTAGIRTTYGSPAFRDFVPSEDSIVVERLRAAGAIVVGKTNTSEFGLLGETRNPLIGETRNPWDPLRTVGGSSGGSAAAVAAGMVPVAVGSDTGGSITCPAAMCGVFGIKPTRGLVPTWPDPGDSRILLDSGPITRTVPDAQLMLDVLGGSDPRDPTSYVQADGGDAPASPLRIAWSPDWDRLAVDPEVRNAAAAAVTVFERLGHHVEAARPAVGDPFEIMLPIVAADTCALLERAELELSDLSVDAALEVELLGAPTITELVRALNALTRFRRTVDAFFERFDVMVTPATAVAAFPLAQAPSSIDGQAVDPRWTTFMPFQAPWNLAGQPTATLPCGQTGDGLPIGLLVSGPRGRDRMLLRVCAEFEQASPWGFAGVDQIEARRRIQES
jgi:Asp-tRNA(Asn)/Glu-tRNA(Gln) amidotransferase A subunit family amidase